MEFRVLGPLEIADNGRVLQLGSGRQLALVALLLLHRNHVVSTERIVDELWEGSPPPTATKIVRNAVSLLRKELGERLVTRQPGYMLRVEPGELDADRLHRAIDDGSPEALSEALALWRGAPLDQVAYYEFARTEVERLEELRLTGIEARIEAELERGQHARLVPELEALVRGHPLRERLREQLMVALYRSGRQASALEGYQDARRKLDAELGLEPGRRLQELERKILTQDVSLDAPPAPPTHSAIARRRRGAVLIALGAALLLAGGIAAAAITLSSGGSTKSLTRVAPNSVGVIDPKTNRIVAEVPVGDTPTAVALGGGSVWVVNGGDNTVSRIDADKRIVLRTIPLPGPADAIAAGEDGAWVVYVRSGSGLGTGSAGAAFIDARFNDVTRTVVLNRLFEGGDAIALGAGSVWAADLGFVTRVDPVTGKILAPIPVGSTGRSGVAVGEGAVWAIGFPGVVRIDPGTRGIVATIPVAQNVSGGGPSPTAIAVGEDAVWVANVFAPAHGVSPSGKRGTVSRIDPRTNAVVATITVGHEPFAIAAGGGAVWVANRTDFTVSRIDPRTNRVTATIQIGNRPQGIAAGNGAVWVSVG
jgi:YVTN family beta-propeller protein